MRALFGKRIEDFQKKKNKLSALSNRLSTIRLVVFLVFLTLLIWFVRAQDYGFAFLTGLAFFCAYLPLIFYHRRIRDRIWEHQLLIGINQEEINRLDGVFQGVDSGDRFCSLQHPYAKDLDIFGVGSVFQSLDRCFTESGQRRLAHALTSVKNPEEIRAFQEAAGELAPEVDFCQRSRMLGQKNIIREEAQADLMDWFGAEEDTSWRTRTRWMVAGANGLSLATIVAVFFSVSWHWLLLPFALNGVLLRLNRKRARAVMEQTEKSASFLLGLSVLLSELETSTFTSVKLVSVRNALKINNIKASALVRSLAFRFSMLEYARNPYFYLLANMTFLWELHWMTSIESWRILARSGIANWIDALNDFEVISSYGGLAYANPDWIFPDIEEKDFCYEARDLAHPLIFSSRRVSNDFSMRQTGETWILTGSNMSGKSTFLRALGVNAALALAGAPVCAGAMTISPMRVFTSMRTEDNLQESTSSFYAELKRLKQLLDYLDGGLPVFYLLDEILKGTNSADRQAGSRALVRHLQGKKASGLIATHDLELGGLSAVYPDTVFNYSFNSALNDGVLTFDYALHRGVCHSFNATELMKQIGIDIAPEDR